MTPVQKWTVKLSEARGKLADALEADEPDAEEIQKLTREVRQADEALTAATLLEPDTPAPVVTETRQYDSKLAELRASRRPGPSTSRQRSPEPSHRAGLKASTTPS